jgi:hypothetical protein
VPTSSRMSSSLPSTTVSCSDAHTHTHERQCTAYMRV